jgi:hypothetical protein
MTARFKGTCCYWCSAVSDTPQLVKDTPGTAYCATMGRLFADYKFQCKRCTYPAGGANQAVAAGRMRPRKEAVALKPLARVLSDSELLDALAEDSE